MSDKTYKKLCIGFCLSFVVIMAVSTIEIILLIYHKNSGYVLSYITLALLEAWFVFLAVFLNFREKFKSYNSRYQRVLKEIEKERFDDLTSLYNRDNFVKYANKKIHYMTPKYTYYMLQFDIDNFSVYNDFFGTLDGNELLLRISRKIKELKTKYGFLSGRLYNDVFVILIDSDLTTVSTIISEIKTDADNFNSKFNINLTFGVVEIKNRTENAETILNHCKLAVIHDKGNYEKTFCLYSESMGKKEYRVQEILNNMEYALSNNEFCIYLQPKCDVYTNEIIGAESLVRWVKNGMIISPSEFVPIFEQNGFIIQLDTFVWNETLKYLKWRMDNNMKMFPISVNVSRKFLTIDKFADKMLELVRYYGVDTKYLELELTETIFSDIKTIKSVVDDLRNYGFKILMDDFGSGYSSLNVLKDIDFDVLKIDLKFFSNTNDKSIKIIKEIVNLSKILGIPTIAEGVETEEQINILKSLDCRYAQGFYYSKPVDVRTFNTL